MLWMSKWKRRKKNFEISPGRVGRAMLELVELMEWTTSLQNKTAIIYGKMLSFCDNFCEFTSYYWSMSSQIMLQTSCQGQSLGLQPHKINCEHLQGDLDSVRVIPISVPKRKNSQHPTTFFDRNRIYCNSSRGWLLGLFSFCYWGAGTKTPCMISNNM